MIVYQELKNQFVADVNTHQIEDIIHSKFQEKLGRRTTESEITSWMNSMTYMRDLLMDDDIPSNCGVAIEFQIPSTSKRIDFMLSGYNEKKDESVIIVELKQWSKAEKTNKDAIVKTYVGRADREVSHPSYQAWSYAALMNDFNEYVYDTSLELHPCAYLHNCKDGTALTSEFYQEHLENAPLFLRADLLKLREFIKKNVWYGDDAQSIYHIEAGRIKPSKSLADHVGSLLKGNSEFVLIDDQKLVYETALEKIDNGGKHVIIVQGGPGTGKSVVAINLLAETIMRGKNAQYATRNAAPRAVFEAKLVNSFKKSRISNLFKGTGNYTESPTNVLDTLIIDEAHRLNEKSGMFRNMGENQVKEIINAAKCSVFFLDEDQKVHIHDIGDKEEIERWASVSGAQVTHLELASQFRCNGSDGYISWLDNTLQIRDTANQNLEGLNYDFRVMDSPTELRNLIIEKNASTNKARMLAGYCWDWVSKKSGEGHDITFPEYGFEMQWNLNDDGMLWIMKENSINEIGCIHTSQGLELDYVGVIIGPDIACIDGEILTDATKRSKNDRTVFGFKKLMKESPEKATELGETIIKNTYRTLMTRGMKGCYIYCVDSELQKYFKSKLST